MLGGMDAAFGVGEERAFKMDAEGPCAWPAGLPGLIEEPGEIGQGAQDVVERGGDGGGQIAASAARGEEAADFGDGFRGALHDVMAGGAVGVHVKEGRGEGGAGVIDVVCAGRELSAAAALDGDDAALFYEDDRVEEEVGIEIGSVPECGGGDRSAVVAHFRSAPSC